MWVGKTWHLRVVCLALLCVSVVGCGKVWCRVGLLWVSVVGSVAEVLLLVVDRVWGLVGSLLCSWVAVVVCCFAVANLVALAVAVAAAVAAAVPAAADVGARAKMLRRLPNSGGQLVRVRLASVPEGSVTSWVLLDTEWATGALGYQRTAAAPGSRYPWLRPKVQGTCERCATRVGVWEVGECLYGKLDGGP